MEYSGRSTTSLSFFTSKDVSVAVRHCFNRGDDPYYVVIMDDLTIFHVPEHIANAYCEEYGIQIEECD